MLKKGKIMKNKKIYILVIVLIIVVLLDQFTKFIVDKFISSTLIIIPRILEFTNVKNIGIAFGINSSNIKNIFLSIFVLIIIVNFIIKQFKVIDEKTFFSLGLMLGGAIGNLIDRIIKGGVLDFIKISTFPVFNIADIAIVTGWILLIVNIIKFSKQEKKE